MFWMEFRVVRVSKAYVNEVYPIWLVVWFNLILLLLIILIILAKSTNAWQPLVDKGCQIFNHFFNIIDDVKKMLPREICFISLDFVWDVFILEKIDKQGNSFEFVRFKGVKDVEQLLSIIEDIWIDTYNVRMNLYRFVRGSGCHKHGGPLHVSASSSQCEVLKVAIYGSIC